MKEIRIERTCARNAGKTPLMRISAYAGKISFNMPAQHLLDIYSGDTVKFFEDGRQLYVKIVPSEEEGALKIDGSGYNFTHYALAKYLCDVVDVSHNATLYFDVEPTGTDDLFLLNFKGKKR